MPDYTRTALQEQVLSPLIELIEVQLTELGLSSNPKMCNEYNEEEPNGLLRWNGEDYHPFSFQIQGFETTVEGTSPRVSLTLSNLENAPQYSKTFSQLAFENEDLLKISVLRYQVWREDIATPPNNINSTGFLVDDYRIVGVDEDNKLQIKFSLASILDLPNYKLPLEIMTRFTFPALDKFDR